MCLIGFALDAHDDYALLIAANRDEYYDRDTSAAGWWNDRPGVYGGRDRRAGGSWLAVDRNGRIAAVTNVREPGMASARRSRGDLVGDFVGSTVSASDYAARVLARVDEYAGFNLLLFDLSSSRPALFVSNREANGRGLRAIDIRAGIHGVSNGGFDSDWPKVSRLSSRISDALTDDAGTPLEAALLRALADRSLPADDELPDTGVGLVRERALAPALIALPDLGYGTRASTVVAVRRDGRLEMIERSWVPADGTPRLAGERRVRMRLPTRGITNSATARELAAS